MPRRRKRVEIDWRECAEVEIVPGKLSGRPVIKGSRVRPEDLIVNRDEGTEWLAENHGLPLETVREVLAFYDRKKARLRSRRRLRRRPEHLSVYQTSPELWEREAFEEKLDGAPEATGEPGQSSAGELGRLAVRAFFSAGAGLLV